MKIYTRSGDGGETGLFGGERVSKAATRVRTYGELDELNCWLGMAGAMLPAAGTSGGEAGDAQPPVAAELRVLLRRLQRELMCLGAELATPAAAGHDDGTRIDAEHVRALEAAIDRLSRELPPLRNFVLPGGAPAAAALHVARAVCRRVERAVVTLHAEEGLRPELLPYLNRLSDLLFVMARAANLVAGEPEALWSGHDVEDADGGC